MVDVVVDIVVLLKKCRERREIKIQKLQFDKDYSRVWLMKQVFHFQKSRLA